MCKKARNRNKGGGRSKSCGLRKNIQMLVIVAADVRIIIASDRPETNKFDGCEW